jgi:hypothetical protein
MTEPNERSAPVREPMPMPSTAGQFITETLEYDGGRQVTAYVPAAAAEAVVFAGDGQLIASWGEVLEAADLPSTMIIGAHRVEDETLRLHEYSPGRSTAAFAFDPHRFAAHEKFLVEDVRRWAATRLAVRLPVGRGTVLPRQRDPVGGRAARGRRGRCHGRTGGRARRRLLETRVCTDGGVGVRTLTYATLGVVGCGRVAGVDNPLDGRRRRAVSPCWRRA